MLCRADCEAVFPDTITDNMVCAGSPGHATCMVGGVTHIFKTSILLKLILVCCYILLVQGDSGGPLVCPDQTGRGRLAGIVSFGYSDCSTAGVYTKYSLHCAAAY